jgi:hypothetical protein
LTVSFAIADANDGVWISLVCMVKSPTAFKQLQSGILFPTASQTHTQTHAKPMVARQAASSGLNPHEYRVTVAVTWALGVITLHLSMLAYVYSASQPKLTLQNRNLKK